MNRPAPESKENWLLAALFGLTFGFLLQRGGMGKHEVLVGQLLLQDWAVAKVMLTAILVGMLGLFTLHSAGKIQLHYKPTRLGANIVGGLLFGDDSSRHALVGSGTLKRTDCSEMEF